VNGVKKWGLPLLVVATLVGGLPPATLVGGLPAVAMASPATNPPSGSGGPSPAASPPTAPAAAAPLQGRPATDDPAPPPTPDLTQKEGWTETSHWRRNPDGSTTRDLYPGPEFRPNGAGWEPIDPTIKPTSKPGFALAAEGAVRPVRFGTDASRLVQLELDHGPVTLSAPALRVGAPDPSGAGVSYADVAPDTELRYRVGSSGVKEELVLGSSAAPQQFRFHLADPGGQLGAVHAQDDGSYRFDAKVGSDLAVVLPAPVAYEAPANGDRVAPAAGSAPTSAHLSVTAAGDGFDLVLAIDAQWAKDKHFPIVLDPTVSFQPASNQAQVSTGCAPGCDTSAGEFLEVGTTPSSTYRAMVDFDLSSIPPSSTISAASVGLYWDRWCLNDITCYAHNYTFELHRMTNGPWKGSPWVNGSSVLTWNWADANYDRTVLSTASHPATNGNDPARWFNWDATGTVQSWVNGQSLQYGFLLKLSDETLNQQGLAFFSSTTTQTTDITLRPKLTVTYTASNKPYAPDQLSPNAARFTTSPALQARYRDSSGLAGQVFFEVRNPAGAVVASAWSAQVASGATASWTPPTLGDGTYTWRAEAYNGAAYSPWSATDAFALAQAPATGPGIGEQRFYKFETVGLSDRMHADLDVANGNLVLHEHDLGVTGTGLNLAVDRYYNSQSSASYDLGAGWVMGTGRDVGLALAPDGSQVFEGPSGFRASFAKNPDGSYTTPTGLDATMVKNADATFTLSFHATGEKLNFSVGGYLASDVDRNTNTIAFAYTPASLLSSVTDTQGRVATFAYNGVGQLTSMADSTSRTYRYGYDANGNLTTYTDPATKATAFAYDGSHRLTQVTDPLGHVTKFAYDASGRLSTLTRVTNTVAGTGPTTTYTYKAGSTVATDPNAHATTYTYDSIGRVTKVVDAAGNATQDSYTADSNVATHTDALNAVARFSYDTKDNLTAATSPTGAGDQWSYADAAHPYFASNHTNSQGNTLAYTYDGPGNLTASQDGLAANNQLHFTYNANGTPATGTDAMGNVTYFGYDGAGNLTGLGRPLNVNSATLAYDNLSRLTSVTDAKSQATSGTYDALDRLTRLSYADGSSVAYTYDADGNLTQRVDATGTTTYGFDAVNQLVSETVGGVTITATYDGVGNLTSVTDPGGKVSYAYNQLNLLTTLSEPNAKNTTFGYDAAYRRTTTAYPNGVTQTITYDASGRETRVTAKNAGGTLLTDFTYSYTNPATGRDTGVRYHGTALAGATADYSYDAVDRLVDAQISNAGHYQYSYDGNGNRLSQTVGTTATNYAYNGANELTGDGARTYSYDNNGNLTTTSDGTSDSYNAKNQTTAMKPPGLLAASVAMTYAGPDQTERTKAANTTFTNDLLGLAVATDPGLLGLGTVNTYYTRDNRGNLVEERLSGGNYYYLFDGLGSVVALTDATGAVVNRYQYDPYGNPISSGTSGNVVNPWQFAGGYHDSTGLYKFAARYYEPATGRWTQRDAFGEASDGDTYVYAGDDPINLLDPSGRNPISNFIKRCGRGFHKIGVAGGGFALFGYGFNLAEALTVLPEGFGPGADLAIAAAYVGSACAVG
jgi:RHS repeat-associated protein